MVFQNPRGLELAEYGITVNTINPGWVNTELGKESIEESEFTEEEIYILYSAEKICSA